MRPLFILTLLISLAWCVPADAQDFKGGVKYPKNPIVLGGGDTPRLAVTFNHSTHKDVTCDTCHHKPRCAICHYSPSLEKSPYASCSTEGCHTVQGRSNQENSRFMAFHDRDSVRSCFGCHQSLSEKYAEFKGCRPCHSGGQEAEGK